MPTDDELRAQLLAVLNRPEHAPMSTHSPADGSCSECPWPLHMLPVEDIADALVRFMLDAVAAERERCARIAEAEGRAWQLGDGGGTMMSSVARSIAVAIRADREPEPATEERKIDAD